VRCPVLYRGRSGPLFRAAVPSASPRPTSSFTRQAEWHRLAAVRVLYPAMLQVIIPTWHPALPPSVEPSAHPALFLVPCPVMALLDAAVSPVLRPAFLPPGSSPTQSPSGREPWSAELPVPSTALQSNSECSTQLVAQWISSTLRVLPPSASPSCPPVHRPVSQVVDRVSPSSSPSGCPLAALPVLEASSSPSSSPQHWSQCLASSALALPSSPSVGP
jgi:hypothetical protein